MKVWPIDPLVPRNLRLEVPEKLPQGLDRKILRNQSTLLLWKNLILVHKMVQSSSLPFLVEGVSQERPPSPGQRAGVGEVKADTIEALRFPSEMDLSDGNFQLTSDTFDGSTGPESEGVLDTVDRDGSVVVFQDGPSFAGKRGQSEVSKVANKQTLTREALRQQCQEGSHAVRAPVLGSGALLAQQILDQVFNKPENLFQPDRSWCVYCTLTPTKENGYIQLSYRGANKFALLHEVILWSKGVSRPNKLKTFYPENGETIVEEWQVSHLCSHPRCIVSDHIILEHTLDNQQRKNCLPWTRCSRDCRACLGEKVILLCQHDPPCIKWHPTYTSMEDLVARGVCMDEREAIRNERWSDRQAHEGLTNPVDPWPTFDHRDSSAQAGT